MDDDLNTIVPIISGTGNQIFRVEARPLGGREKVSALDGFSPEDLKKPIEAIARTVLSVLQAISPTKATAEFEVEVAVESGHLIALWCKGSGKANLKVTLEWSGNSSDKPA